MFDNFEREQGAIPITLAASKQYLNLQMKVQNFQYRVLEKVLLSRTGFVFVNK
jgi:hypothetical protein